jgi:hypothetical protein
MTSKREDEFNNVFHALYAYDFETGLAARLVFFSGVEMPMLIRTNFRPTRNFSSMAFSSAFILTQKGIKASVWRAAHLDLRTGRQF